jgi:hypothetical protein
MVEKAYVGTETETSQWQYYSVSRYILRDPALDVNLQETRKNTKQYHGQEIAMPKLLFITVLRNRNQNRNVLS